MINLKPSQLKGSVFHAKRLWVAACLTTWLSSVGMALSDKPGSLHAVQEHATSKGVNASPKVDAAPGLSILFVGNSHTTYHDLPNWVGKMIQWSQPERTVHVEVIGVSFLEELAQNQHAAEVLAGRSWTFVILQAQKISMSGRYQYSQKEGIDFAKQARARGARVFFFSEWGRKDVPGDSQAIEKIYREMADAAGAEVAPIGRAWDLALAEQPGLKLHDADGNHETALGAFLTACVLYGQFTGKNPSVLSGYPYPHATDAEREFLAKAAARTQTVLSEDASKPNTK